VHFHDHDCWIGNAQNALMGDWQGLVTKVIDKAAEKTIDKLFGWLLGNLPVSLRMKVTPRNNVQFKIVGMILLYVIFGVALTILVHGELASADYRWTLKWVAWIVMLGTLAFSTLIVLQLTARRR